MKLYLTRDKRGKLYFVKMPSKTIYKVETIHRQFPQLRGLRTAEAVEKLKLAKVVEVEI